MGHVPTGPIPPASQGADFPGRQHRGTGTRRADLTAQHIGSLGERLAEGFLVRRGALVLARNTRIGRGEIDLIVRIGGQRAAVEVKTVWSGPGGLHDAALAFTQPKAAQVRQLANLLRIRRVDLVAVALDEDGAGIRWIPYAA